MSSADNSNGGIVSVRRRAAEGTGVGLRRAGPRELVGGGHKPNVKKKDMSEWRREMCENEGEAVELQ